MGNLAMLPFAATFSGYASRNHVTFDACSIDLLSDEVRAGPFAAEIELSKSYWRSQRLINIECPEVPTNEALSSNKCWPGYASVVALVNLIDCASKGNAKYHCYALFFATGRSYERWLATFFERVRGHTAYSAFVRVLLRTSTGCVSHFETFTL